MEYNSSDGNQRGDPLGIDYLLQEISICIIGFPRWLLSPAKNCAEEENGTEIKEEFILSCAEW